MIPRTRPRVSKKDKKNPPVTPRVVMVRVETTPPYIVGPVPMSGTGLSGKSSYDVTMPKGYGYSKAGIARYKKDVAAGRTKAQPSARLRAKPKISGKTSSKRKSKASY